MVRGIEKNAILYQLSSDFTVFIILFSSPYVQNILNYIEEKTDYI